MNFDEMQTWQQSLQQSDGDPAWREIQTVEGGSVDDEEGIEQKNVVFKPQKLNNGFLITNESDGHYESEADFWQSYEALLGISYDTDEKRVTNTQQGGRTQKIDIDYSSEKVDPLPSTGEFIIDALTNKNGEVVIDGEAYTVFPDGDRNDSYDPDGEMTTQTQSLAAGNWSTQFKVGAVFGGFLGIVNWRSKLFNYEENGKSTYRTCSFLVFGCEKHTVEADRMHLATGWIGNYDFYEISNSSSAETEPRGWQKWSRRYNVEDLRHQYHSTGVNKNVTEMCARGEVEDSGVEDWGRKFTRNEGYWDWKDTWCFNPPGL